MLNGLRFLAYKEKFLAGSWRFLTYFGRDSLISLRMITPIVNIDVLENGLSGVMGHLNDNGEISHEEDLGDQAFIDQIDQIDQMNKANNFNKTPQQLVSVINNYNMVDENYLAMTLLLDYYQLGGRNLFQSSNSNYAKILNNMNYVLNEALNNDLIPIHSNSGNYVGDWRDSNTGLAYGRYSVAVNTGHIPSALNAIILLLQNNAWDMDQLTATATSMNLEAITEVLNNNKVLTTAYTNWLNNWQKFHVQMTNANQIADLNRHRSFIGLSNYTGTNAPYTNGFLALSLDANQQQIPIINSDSVFMLLDNNLSNELLDLAIKPFNVNFPDGLYSNAGNLVAPAALSPESLVVPSPPDLQQFSSYYSMFANDQYHGEVIWGWQQVLLNVALQKQLGKWITPAPSNNLTSDIRTQLEQTLNTNSNLLSNLGSLSASELWTWKLVSGKVKPTAYGQSGGDNTSNAEQLWSVAAIGQIPWSDMQKNPGYNHT